MFPKSFRECKGESMPIPHGMTGGKVQTHDGVTLGRVLLTETPGNPAYALRQDIEILMILDEPQELYDAVVRIMEPFNPVGVLDAISRALDTGDTVTITGLLESRPQDIVDAEKLRKNPSRRPHLRPLLQNRNETADTDGDEPLPADQQAGQRKRAGRGTGMSVDHYRRFMEIWQQLLWSGNSPAESLLALQRFVLNFLLAADGLGALRDKESRKIGSWDRPRYFKSQWAASAG